MLSLPSWLAFAAVCLAMVLTPGPNMAYLISRSICQGRQAGMISLSGIVTGFAIYVLLASFGITALFAAVPYAYDVLRIGGATYLAYLAWQALRPNGTSPLAPRALDIDPPARLYTMGLLTSLLNPKVAMLYLSLFPQFIDPGNTVLAQSLLLGVTQIVISATVNSLIIMTAGAISAFLTTRPFWARAQRWVMGTVLGLLAVRMAMDKGR